MPTNHPPAPVNLQRRAWSRLLLAAAVPLALWGCGGGGGDEPAPAPPPPLPPPPALPPADVWATVAARVNTELPKFVRGLTLEVLTPAGVVYSQSFGGFANTTLVPVASASKMVSAAVFLRLVEQGVFSLDTQTRALLRTRQGQPWSGNMGEIRLRELLSFTAGISSEVPASEVDDITLIEAVHRIYEDQSPVAEPPGSSFFYGGSPHMRIAARMAEIATGKTWRQIFAEQIAGPLGFGPLSGVAGATNPNPAGALVCTGLEYTRFLMMQLRAGLDGTARLLSPASIAQQRTDGFTATTTIRSSPYLLLRGYRYHYGMGNWLETANGAAPAAGNPVSAWSSAGKFGWLPWITADGRYAALIMTRQDDLPTAFLPSVDLQAQLDGPIRAALATHPPVVRQVP